MHLKPEWLQITVVYGLGKKGKIHVRAYAGLFAARIYNEARRAIQVAPLEQLFFHDKAGRRQK